jgi:hypothetical protein
VGLCAGDRADLAGRELSEGGQNLKDFTAMARGQALRRREGAKFAKKTSIFFAALCVLCAFAVNK